MKRVLFIFLVVLVVGAILVPTIAMAAETKNVVAVVAKVEEEDTYDILDGVTVTFIEVKPQVPSFIEGATVKIVEEVDVPEETVVNEEDVEEAEFEEEVVVEECFDETETVENTETPKWNGEVLKCKKGYVEYGPTGYETWYDLDMSVVVKNMKEKYGIDLEYWIDEETGLKMYGDYIMVAADTRSKGNPNGIFEYGDIIEVSHGTAMAVDCCRLAITKREQSGKIHIDVATDWDHTYGLRD